MASHADRRVSAIVLAVALGIIGALRLLMNRPKREVVSSSRIPVSVTLSSLAPGASSVGRASRILIPIQSDAVAELP